MSTRRAWFRCPEDVDDIVLASHSVSCIRKIPAAGPGFLAVEGLAVSSARDRAAASTSPLSTATLRKSQFLLFDGDLDRRRDQLRYAVRAAYWCAHARCRNAVRQAGSLRVLRTRTNPGTGACSMPRAPSAPRGRGSG